MIPKWQECQDPMAMAVSIQRSGRVVSSRRRILLGCACVRKAWENLSILEKSAVRRIEQLADGSDEEMSTFGTAEWLLWRVSQGHADQGSDTLVVWSALTAHEKAGGDLLVMASVWQRVAIVRGENADPPWAADLIREVVGDPDAHVGEVDTQRTRDVLALAEGAYEHRDIAGRLDNNRMAVLADALEEAGRRSQETCKNCLGEGQYCVLKNRNPNEGPPARLGWWELCDRCLGEKVTYDPLLKHLRQGGSHYRGCWVLDLIRGMR